MKLWGRERTDADPWDRPEQRNAVDPWEDTDRKETRDPWDGADRKETRDPWEGAGWTDAAKSLEEMEQEAYLSPEQGDEPPAVPEQENEPSSITEQEGGMSTGYGMQIAGAVMTLVSYVLLFRLPDEMTPGAYGFFFLSVLLFSLGFFWVTADLPEPVTKAGTVLRNAGICVGAAVLLAAACWNVSARGGSEGSVYVGTVLLIQSIVFLMALDDGWKETQTAKYVFRAVCAALAGWGVRLFIRSIIEDSAGDGLISAATMLWIASITLYGMFGTGMKKAENGDRDRKGKRRQKIKSDIK